MKQCTECGNTKSEGDFPWKSKAEGKRHSQCKACIKIKQAAHYQKNKPVYLARAKKNTRAQRQRLQALKEGRPCTDCSAVLEPRQMHWDHVDPSTKLFDLSSAPGRKAWRKIQAELKKCELVCFRCHEKRTSARFAVTRAAKLSAQLTTMVQSRVRPVDLSAVPEIRSFRPSSS